MLIALSPFIATFYMQKYRRNIWICFSKVLIFSLYIYIFFGCLSYFIICIVYLRLWIFENPQEFRGNYFKKKKKSLPFFFFFYRELEMYLECLISESRRSIWSTSFLPSRDILQSNCKLLTLHMMLTDMVFNSRFRWWCVPMNYLLMNRSTFLWV